MIVAAQQITAAGQLEWLGANPTRSSASLASGYTRRSVESLERLFQWNALKPIAHQNKGCSLVSKRNRFKK